MAHKATQKSLHRSKERRTKDEVLLTENSPVGSPLYVIRSSCRYFAKGMRRILSASSAPKVYSTTSLFHSLVWQLMSSTTLLSIDPE
ncbi:hypothetical protein EPI10_010445 [Gossypium australe]|uniref:Uncharacterized protein n=1 Tax=Gossypium australe TaxID=47621 RepID=A0A5B6W5F9_9ROSI|nr:hypothetical protein EPI10_010445 [Gossypium australe]